MSREADLAAIILYLVLPGVGAPIQASQQQGADTSVSIKPSSPQLPRFSFGWYDPNQIFSCGFNRIAREVESSFGQMGVVATLQGGPSYVPASNAINLKVVLLPYNYEIPNSKRKMLGAIRGDGPVIGNEIPPRTIFIFFANFLCFIGYEEPEDLQYYRSISSRWCKPEHLQTMARAPARILVHETVHAIAPDILHTTSGLMHDMTTKDFLTRRGFDIPPSVKSRFQSKVSIALKKQGTSNPIATHDKPPD